MPVYNAAATIMTGTGNGSGQVASAFDNRAGANFGYLYYSAAGASAILNVVASHDQTAWMIAQTVTATTGVAGGTASLTVFYPYIGIRPVALFSGAAGTANLIVHYTPGAI